MHGKLGDVQHGPQGRKEEGEDPIDAEVVPESARKRLD